MTKAVFGTKGLGGREYYLRLLAPSNGPSATCALAIDAAYWAPNRNTVNAHYSKGDRATA